MSYEVIFSPKSRRQIKALKDETKKLLGRMNIFVKFS